MKKILFLALITMLFSNAFATNLPTDDQGNGEYIYFKIVEVTGTTMAIDVYENSVVDEFCNFLKRKDIAASVSLWCAFMPTNPVCIAYGVTMAACQAYGAVRLYIEGDFSNAIIETINASTKVYKMSKVDLTEYKIE